MLYYYKTFESTILSDFEQDEFLDFLRKNNKLIVDHSWKLLYKSSKDGFDQKVFVDKVFDNPNVIMLWQINGQCVIGGYTKTGWNKEFYQSSSINDSNYESWTKDKDVFIFYFKSKEKHASFISNVKQDKKSISRSVGYCYQSIWQSWIYLTGSPDYYDKEEIVLDWCDMLFMFTDWFIYSFL